MVPAKYIRLWICHWRLTTNGTTIGFTGEAAVAESALEAPTNAEDHPDDKRCPDPESKCSDCLALNGMCTTGEAAGCSCEEESCPTGDKQPKCSDPKCEGNDDKKCTNENKGCECTEACPSGDQQPKCSDPICKGDDDKKCTNENKGCECADNSKDCPSKIEETPLCDKCGGNKDGKCIGVCKGPILGHAWTNSNRSKRKTTNLRDVYALMKG